MSAVSSQTPFVLAAALFAMLLGIAMGFVGGIGVTAVVLFGAVAAASVVHYRVGVGVLLFLAAFLGTRLVPRQMAGIPGLNLYNILLLLVLTGFVLSMLAHRMDSAVRLLPKVPVHIALLVLLLFLGAANGTRFLSMAPMQTDATGALVPLTFGKYLAEHLARGLIILLSAYLVAEAAANLLRPARLLAGLFGGQLVFAVVILGSLAVHGLALESISGSSSRRFLSWTGMHANEIGLMFNMACALALYGGLHALQARQKLLLIGLAGLFGGIAALTFSRGAFLGLVLNFVYFVVSRRRPGVVMLAVVVAALVLLVLPAEFYQRASTGLAGSSRSAGDVSAGRVNNIWLPLLAEVPKHPFFGSGTSSTLWAEANRRGSMLNVGHPHSAYLGVLLDYGIAGLAFFAWFVWRLLKDFNRGLSALPPGRLKGFAEGGRVCVLILLVQGVTDDRFVPSIGNAVLWLAYGMVLGLTARIDAARATGPASP